MQKGPFGHVTLPTPSQQRKTDLCRKAPEPTFAQRGVDMKHTQAADAKSCLFSPSAEANSNCTSRLLSKIHFRAATVLKYCIWNHPKPLNGELG